MKPWEPQDGLALGPFLPLCKGVDRSCPSCGCHPAAPGLQEGDVIQCSGGHHRVGLLAPAFARSGSWDGISAFLPLFSGCVRINS